MRVRADNPEATMRSEILSHGVTVAILGAWMVLGINTAAVAQQASPSTPPRLTAEENANMVQAVETMQTLYRTFGACEAHWPRANVERLKAAFQPERGQRPNGVQALMAEAYEAGRRGEPRSAAFCREVAHTLSERSARR